MLEKLIRLAHENPETRPHLLPIIKEAMKFKTPEALKKYLDSHPKADKARHTVGTPSPADKLRSELKKDIQQKKKKEKPAKPSPADKLRSELQKDMKKKKKDEKAPEKKAPAQSKYNNKVQTVMTKHDLTDDDANEVKSFKKKKPDTGTPVSPAVLLQKFLAKAKPETKERMKGVSPADFMKMLGAIMDEEDGGGKQAFLRAELTRIASEYPETRKHLIPLLKE